MLSEEIIRTMRYEALQIAATAEKNDIDPLRLKQTQAIGAILTWVLGEDGDADQIVSEMWAELENCRHSFRVGNKIFGGANHE